MAQQRRCSKRARVAAASATELHGATTDMVLDQDDKKSMVDMLSMIKRPQRLPLTQQARAELDQVAAQQVICKKGAGRAVALQDALNLDFTTQIARFVMEPGVHNVLGVEQSDKSLVIAGAAIANRATGANKPMVVLVKDMVASVPEVRSKMGFLLDQFDIQVRFANTKTEFAAFQRAFHVVEDWLRGRTLLIAPANHTPLGLLNDMLERYGVSDLVVVLDESDSMWTHELTAAELVEARRANPAPGCAWWDRLHVTERERQMYRLLGAPPMGHPDEHGGAGSRVASFVQVSATHLATLHWQACMRLPYLAYSMDTATVRKHGFATYDVFQPFVLDGEPQYLQPADITKRTRHGLDLPVVRAFLSSFGQDDRPYRLMQVSLTSFVNSACSTTALQVAAVAQDLVPEARVLIKSGVGVTVFREGKTKKIEARTVERERDGVRIASMASVLQAIDEEPGGSGADVPVIVVGMQCVRRCTSVRSNERVITHMLAVAGSSMTSADTEQLLARALGRTVEARRRHGYDHVCVLTTQADLDLVKCSLYGCTARFMELSGTGRKEDLDRWRTEACPLVFAPVLEASRPHARRALGVEAAVASIPLESPPPTPQQQQEVDEQEPRAGSALDMLFDSSSSEDEEEKEQHDEDDVMSPPPATASASAAEQRGLALLLSHHQRRRQPGTTSTGGNVVVDKEKLWTGPPLNQRAALERCKKILGKNEQGGDWSNESTVLGAASLVASDGFPFVKEQLSEAAQAIPVATQDTDQLVVLAAGLALALDRSSTCILRRLTDKGLLGSKAGMYCLIPDGWAQARAMLKHLA